MADSGHDAHAPADAPRPGAGHRALRWLIEAAVILVGAVVIATLLRTFVAQMFVIPSTSMENTLQVHDRILVAKFGGFQRGDVVVFEDPGNWLGPPEPNTDGLARALEFVGVLPDSGTGHLVKRAVGMPGDHVRLNDQGLIEVNGAALDEAAYLYARDGVQVAPATVPFDIVVPQGHIFVMGTTATTPRTRAAVSPTGTSASPSCPSTRWSVPRLPSSPRWRGSSRSACPTRSTACPRRTSRRRSRRS